MEQIKKLFEEFEVKYPELDIQKLKKKYERQTEKVNQAERKFDSLILSAVENISKEEPDWTYVASEAHLGKLKMQAKEKRVDLSFYNLIKTLTKLEVYDEFILEKYSKKEIEELESSMEPSRDSLFNYAGLRTLSDRYLATTKKGETMELPQERYMIIAMALMQNEEVDRLKKVKESYWALSNHYMVTATPTLANAGKVGGQLSSCFIDTVQDDLRSIYDSNTDFAQISKNGGGVGVYMGKIRGRGAPIRGHKGMSSGVISWMKQLNTTAVNVDQLGKRKGAITVYLDVWHKDIQAFLDVKLNNGDARMRTHDIFTGVTLPDIFLEAVEERKDWYLFDPYEVKEVMGYSLEDFYDEELGKGSFRDKYRECVNNKELSKDSIPAIEIMKRIMISQLETGTPFMFYRDTVNRYNTNPQSGMIYCSNLCTEITQNQSETVVEEEYLRDGKIITIKEPGDMVVCNLSSINLARAYKDDVLERLIPIQIRMLDNSIDINNLPVLQAEHTNQKYRSVGLGTFGLHHLLALKNIHWESQEAVDLSDELYEKIAYLSIKSSMELSKEKESYPLFKGSQWDNGEYFKARGYLNGDSDLDWEGLMNDVKSNGMRNAYLMAVAPNATTSIILGSTASIDPIFDVEYAEEKKDYRIPVTAPDYTEDTKDFYKSAYEIDQLWSIKQNAARQKHIDQAISFNLYVKNTVKAAELLNYHLESWKQGLKTTYYVRSTSS